MALIPKCTGLLAGVDSYLFCAVAAKISRFTVCVIWLIPQACELLLQVLARPPQLYFRTPSHTRVNASEISRNA